jgi:hypothetical protein
MTPDQFAACCRMLAGETIRDLRHIREVPRFSMHIWHRHASRGARPRDLASWRSAIRAKRCDQMRTRKTS